MAEKHERFSHYCSGVQAIGMTVALLLGGGWSIYLYNQLHESERASAQWYREQAELAAVTLKNERDRSEMHRAFGQITLTATSLGHSGRNHCYLQVVAKVSNAGSKQIRLKFDGTDPLHVAVLNIRRDGELDFVPAGASGVMTFSNTGLTVRTLPGSKLLPGETVDYPFVLRIPRNRLYLVQFGVPVDTASDQRSDRAAAGWFWVARGYATACPSPSGFSSSSGHLASAPTANVPQIE